MAAKKKTTKKRTPVTKTFYVIYTERGSGDTLVEEFCGPDTDTIARRFVNKLNNEGYEHDQIQDQEFVVVPAADEKHYNLRVGFALEE